jgi:small-conductance mechanosensitive channel
LVLDRLLGALGRRLLGPTPPSPERGEASALTPTQGAAAALFEHCARVGLWVLAAVLLIRIWAVDLVGLIPADQWASSGRSILSAGVTLFVAYVAWRIVNTYVRSHMEAAGAIPHPGEEEPPGAPPKAATRLRTMLPLLRVFMLASIAVLAALTVLSDLGINTTPLIAGASVFGLALSFGSQSLVHDVVSGIFFMADDAFRVGEYIDTGKLKGTVEGMSIRSLRLRHQNGQIHTIPFGQLQSVTNFSRDWATVKFNLRLARDTDIDHVRKTVKQIGIEMMADPEIGPEMIQPLKLQGVADIDQIGLVCRLKFTTRPTNPSLVQHEALKRIHRAFQAKGIRFAEGPWNS